MSVLNKSRPGTSGEGFPRTRPGRRALRRPARARTPARARLLPALKQLGEYRDAVLVLVSVVYLLGYLSWAYYAGENDLGLLPALDTQYLVAGVAPAIILAFAIGLGALQLRFARWSAARPSERRFRWGSFLAVAAFVLMVGGFAVGELLHGAAENVAVAAGVAGTYVLMAGTLLQGARGWAPLRYYGLGVLWLVVAFIPVLMLLWYFDSAFPHLPSALGGPGPRCVMLDVAANELSARTRRTLLAGGEPASAADSTHVLHTRPLTLMFSGPEFVIVRSGANTARGYSYSIAKRTIVALAPCAATPAQPAAPSPTPTRPAPS